MKTLNTILYKGYHRHFPIGAAIMSALLFLATFSESLRYLERILICLVILAIGCFGFEIKQDWGKPQGERQTNKAVLGDVLAGVFAGVFITIVNIQSHLTGNYTLEVVVLVILLGVGYYLERKRKKELKK